MAGAGRNDTVVRYSLADTAAPLAVAHSTYDSLPTAEQDAVPTDTELAELAGTALTQLASQSDSHGAPSS